MTGQETIVTSYNRGNINWTPGRQIFPMRVVTHYSKMPREAMGLPSLEIFQILLGKTLRNLIQLSS